MIRLHVVAEGQTEERFVNRVLCAHLAESGVYCDVRCIQTGRDKRGARNYKGGLLEYGHLKRDLERWMKQDRHDDAWFTTMVDLYALPADFPNHDLTGRVKRPADLVLALEQSMEEDISHPRFVPYIQLHEYEALVLCEPSRLEVFFPDSGRAVKQLTQEVNTFSSPEEINQGEHSAPSKRIIARIPQYEEQKATLGPSIAASIGIAPLREKCPHFDEWISRLEGLGH